MKTKIQIFTIAKAIVIFIIGCYLFSCTGNGSGNAITGEKKYSIEIIDGCEYLKKYEGYNTGYSFSHKGNCNNPIHYKVIHDTIYIPKSK